MTDPIPSASLPLPYFVIRDQRKRQAGKREGRGGVRREWRWIKADLGEKTGGKIGRGRHPNDALSTRFFPGFQHQLFGRAPVRRGNGQENNRDESSSIRGAFAGLGDGDLGFAWGIFF